MAVTVKVVKISLNQIKIKMGAFELGPLQFEFSSPGLYLIRGPNGSGKTTLLKLLMRRLRPTLGTMTPISVPIGCVGVEPLLMGNWTVQENFKWFSSLLNQLSPPELHKNIQPYSFLPASKLSSGFKRQVELSLILSLPFQIFLLDEPFNSLDQTQRQLFQKKISDLAQERLMILTSHEEETIFQAKQVMTL